MIYLTTLSTDGHEALVSVTTEHGAQFLCKQTVDNPTLKQVLKSYSLEGLLAANAEQKVIIPEELSWIVNSDRKHRDFVEREKSDESIMDKNSLSFMKLYYTNDSRTLVKHPSEDYNVSVGYAKKKWPSAEFCSR